MAKVKLGNVKGPKGDTGPQGPPGPAGPAGPAGPGGGGGIKFMENVTDMNALKETCFFKCDAKPLNGPPWPASGRMWGICMVSGGYGTQLMWPDSKSQAPAHRPMFGGSWASWE